MESNLTDWLLTNWHEVYAESNRIQGLANDLIAGKLPKDLAVNLVYTLNGDTINEPVGEVINVQFNKSNNHVSVKLLLYVDKMELYNLDVKLMNQHKLPLSLPINVSVFNDSKYIMSENDVKSKGKK
jgi:hypothetical protein